MIHGYIKFFIGCTALLLHVSIYSQSVQVKDSATAALETSNRYFEKASYFNNMDHYNVDSSLYYTDKALEVLDEMEPLHQTALKSLPSFKKTARKDLSSDQVSNLSRAYQDKALWFKEMPHFNRDSTVFYFDMAALLLQNKKPLQYERLAELYLDITDRANRSHNFNVVDSLAPIGWAYYEKTPESKKDKVLGYDLLINWALIKIIRGEPKPGLELFEKALGLLKDDPRPEIQLKILKDKGRFYYRYGLPEEEEIGVKYLKEELLTNALKYAFTKNEKGTIHISLEKTIDNSLKLKIRDNGVGKVTGIAPKGTGFGSQLVQLLTQQFNSKMQEHTNQDTHIEFDFLIKKSA